MRLLSIHVGKPVEVPWAGKRVATGIFKSEVQGPVRVARLNLEGDGQADLSVHGGPDKAVYGYAAEAYAWWRTKLGNPGLAWGAFGENLTIEGLDETALGVGDVLQVGTARFEVCQPRFPCFKLGIKFGDPSILKTFTESGRPGIYFRVATEGEIRRGDAVTIVHRAPVRLTVLEMMALRSGPADVEGLRKALQVTALPVDWREKFQRRLDEALRSPA